MILTHRRFLDQRVTLPDLAQRLPTLRDLF